MLFNAYLFIFSSTANYLYFYFSVYFPYFFLFFSVFIPRCCSLRALIGQSCYNFHLSSSSLLPFNLLRAGSILSGSSRSTSLPFNWLCSSAADLRHVESHLRRHCRRQCCHRCRCHSSRLLRQVPPSTRTTDPCSVADFSSLHSSQCAVFPTSNPLASFQDTHWPCRPLWDHPVWIPRSSHRCYPGATPRGNVRPPHPQSILGCRTYHSLLAFPEKCGPKTQLVRGGRDYPRSLPG